VGGGSSSVAAGLGYPPEGFASTLGAPNDHSDLKNGVLHFRRCASKNLDEFIVTFIGGRAVVVSHQSCGGPPTDASRISEAKPFLPSDSVDRGSVLIPITGERGRRFSSSTLAAAVPSFDTCNGPPPAAGTATLVYTARGWDLAVGNGC
jgi:hypothetical protein